MSRSILNAVSGLRNNQVRIDVIANNIANSNTTGFKRGRMTFEESFALLLQGASRPPGDQGGVNPIMIGLGSSIGAIDTIFGQGIIQSTGNQTDLAIQGDGFFVLNDGFSDYYTRAGSFQFDGSGRLVSPFSGFKVQGRLANEAGVIDEGSSIEDVVVPFGSIAAARGTTQVGFAGNLNSAAIPDGTTTTTAKMYAVENAGDDSDVNYLYAGGSANLDITGMSDGSTIVTVKCTDPTAGDKTVVYTYVEVDTGVRNQDFHSLDDLITEINNDFGTDFMTAALNSSGAIEFTNLASAQNQMTISSVNSALNKALAAANGVPDGTTTDEFSHIAKSSDALTSIRNRVGESLGLQLSDTITINGRTGGTSNTEVTLDVDDGTASPVTFGALADAVKTAFGITNTTGPNISSTNGAFGIEGDGGLVFAVSQVDITANSSTVTGSTAQNFDAVFDATIGNWVELQTATDVTHSAGIRIFDSLGQEHTLTMTYTKDVTLPNKWLWEARMSGDAETTGGNTGYVIFGSDGSLDRFDYDGGATTFSFDPHTGADVPVTIALDFGTSNMINGLSQFAANSTVIGKDQDGYTQGVLDSVTINNSGKIVGLYNNGTSKTIAQLVLAAFNNPSGLMRVGNNSYTLSGNSGLPAIGFALGSINAEITPGAVEMGNVDIAEEFTEMIIAQRSFQACARTITTADELMTEAVNLKR